MGFHKGSLGFPPTFDDSAVKNLLEEYYETSNNPDAHDELSQLFTENAIYVVTSERATGRSEILAFRKRIWGNIPQRDHRAVKVFPFGNSGEELMAFGTVDYNHHDGTQKETEWAARYKVAKEGGKVKLALCHIFLDTADQK